MNLMTPVPFQPIRQPMPEGGQPLRCVQDTKQAGGCLDKVAAGRQRQRPGAGRSKADPDLAWLGCGHVQPQRGVGGVMRCQLPRRGRPRRIAAAMP
jgi:hypothetical protein